MTEITDERCARCGYPRKEHSYNGACYGLCGEFVSTPPRTDAAGGAKCIDPAAIDRLIRWRDVGDGPATYTAGSKQFGDDVIVLLALVSRPAQSMGEEAQKLLRDIIVMDTKVRGTSSEDAYEVEGAFAQKARAVLALLSAPSKTEGER